MSTTDRIRSELRDYYEREAEVQTRGPASGRRVEVLAAFVALLRDEGRASVFDVGAGPGTDAAAFTGAGLRYVGLDLAVGNAVLARRRGHDVVAASLFEPPFPPASFDAGWSMSTLMHVPTGEFDAAVRAALAPLRPGAPCGIGLWGGDAGDVRFESDGGGGRWFSLCSAERNRERLSAFGAIESWQVWDAGAPGWEYHHAVIRTPTGAN